MLIINSTGLLYYIQLGMCMHVSVFSALVTFALARVAILKRTSYLLIITYLHAYAVSNKQTKKKKDTTIGYINTIKIHD